MRLKINSEDCKQSTKLGEGKQKGVGREKLEVWNTKIAITIHKKQGFIM